jgi:maltokinase
MISPDVLEEVLPEYLRRQRWFGGHGQEAPKVRVRSVETLLEGSPAMVQVIVEASPEGQAAASFQVLLGLRPPGAREPFLEGKPEAVIGELEAESGPAFTYDAVIDPVLAVSLLGHVAPDEEVGRARLLGSEQSNTSIVYDDRLIMKLFRRLAPGPNPDAEVTRALAGVGFDHVAAPVAEWRGEDTDYATVNEFLVGSVDGFHFCETSLRDLYDRRCDPADCGGDFAPEATRLGEITARMHVALAEAFGTDPAEPAVWADDMESQLARVAEVPTDSIQRVYRQLRDVADPGVQTRVHGDYHLHQVMRTDAGWFVIDFEGEPARPLEERRRPSSPLKDVAGMLRSFQYAAEIALGEWGDEVDDEMRGLARAWEERNAAAFLAGYLAVEEVHAVLPADEASRTTVLTAFELDKAVYEVGYEQSHRPDWVGIPRSAVDRLLERTR